MDAKLAKYISQNDLIKLLTISHRSMSCTTQEELSQLVLDLRELFSFENAVCAHAKIPDAFTDLSTEINVVDISFPADYMQLYFENNFHLTDAVVYEFLTTLSPVNWLKLDQRCGYNYPASLLALDYNMREGWSYGTLDIATMTCSLFSIGGPRVENDKRVQFLLEYIIPFYSEAYQRVRGKPSIKDHDLTQKEVEVLHWIKEGKSSWEISVILSCSTRTINFHVNNIKNKLHAQSRAQAVAIGLQRGIITF